MWYIHTKLDEMVCKIVVSQIVGVLHTDNLCIPSNLKIDLIFWHVYSVKAVNGSNHGLFFSLFKIFG